MGCGGRLDLDEGIGTLIRCYRSAETQAQIGGDAVGGPGGLGEQIDLSAADRGDSGESIVNECEQLIVELGVGSWIWIAREKVDGDVEARRNAWDS